MYLKKIDGPRAVNLPDGTVMTRADLPPASTRRWVASRKAAIVRAVKYELISIEEAQETYGLSIEELESWTLAVRNFGETALKATAVQQFRRLT